METPFPRPVDHRRAAWPGPDGRFSSRYEARAEKLWLLLEELQLRPEFDWTGSEDGEGLLAYRDGELVWAVHLEDPREQRLIDGHLAHGTARRWISSGIAKEPPATDRR